MFSPSRCIHLLHLLALSTSLVIACYPFTSLVATNFTSSLIVHSTSALVPPFASTFIVHSTNMLTTHFASMFFAPSTSSFVVHLLCKPTLMFRFACRVFFYFLSFVHCCCDFDYNFAFPFYLLCFFGFFCFATTYITSSFFFFLCFVFEVVYCFLLFFALLCVILCCCRLHVPSLWVFLYHYFAS